jgi:tetratricopeptide (TPR) repeat protein
LYISSMRTISISLICAAILLALAACSTKMSPETRLTKLRDLVEDQKFNDALEQVHILRPEIPTDSAFLMLAGRTYLGLNMIDSAHACARQYAVLYPSRLEGYRFLYHTGELLQDYDAQIWCVSQMGYLENNRRKYHEDIARLNFLRGEYGQAMRTCNQIFEYEPNNPQALFIMANSLATIGKTDSAIVIMEKLNKQSPDRVEVLSNLASFLADKKDYKEAAVHFKRLITLYPDYIPGWFGLGNVLVTMGDTTGAIDAYGQVYSRDSTFLGVDSILHELQPFRIK